MLMLYIIASVFWFQNACLAGFTPMFGQHVFAPQLGSSQLLGLISFGVSVSSILIGAATFLLGLYLSGYERPVGKSTLNLYWAAIISLIIPAAIIICFSVSYALQANIEASFKNYLLMVSCIPLIPILVIFAILLIRLPR